MATPLAISALAQEPACSTNAPAATKVPLRHSERSPRSEESLRPSVSEPGTNTNDDASATQSSASSSTATDKEKAAIESALRIEGEKRFRTNCSRCHAAPHKFPPRVMATAVRHMRVRCTLTDEDMRLILHYLTQ